MGLMIKVGDQGHLTVVLMKRRICTPNRDVRNCMCTEKRSCRVGKRAAIYEPKAPEETNSLLAL